MKTYYLAIGLNYGYLDYMSVDTDDKDEVGRLMIKKFGHSFNYIYLLKNSELCPEVKHYFSYR